MAVDISKNAVFLESGERVFNLHLLLWSRDRLFRAVSKNVVQINVRGQELL